MKKICLMFMLLAALFSFPAYAQETSANFAGGSVRVGSDNRACAPALAGSLRYNSAGSGCVEFCDGAAWICPSGVKSSSCNISVTSGLVARYPFDERGGPMAHDIVGNNHMLLANNLTWQPTGGRIGGAVQFSAATDQGDYRGVINSSTLVNLNAFTVCLWYNTPGAWTDIFFTNFQRWRGFGFNDATSQSIYVWINTSGDGFGITTNNAFTLNQWNHMCVTWNGTLNPQTGIHVYRNGAAVTKDWWSANGTGSATSIGEGITALLSYGNFSGYLDDTLIYDRALTSGEVSTVYNNYLACP